MAMSEKKHVAPHRHVSSDIVGGIVLSPNVRSAVRQSLASPYSYLLNKNGSIYEAIDQYGSIAFGGANNEGDADGDDYSAVVQGALDALASTGGLIHQKTFDATALTEIVIPNTTKTIVWEGEGYESSVITAGAALTNVISRESSGPYWHRVMLRDLAVDCANTAQFTGATNGINIADSEFANECPKEIFLIRCRVENHSGYGIIANYCDNTVLQDCMVENPYSTGKCLAWSATSGKVKLIRGYYHPGDIEVAGQSITLDHVQLSGVRVVDDSHALHLIDPEMPNLPVLSTGAFVEVASGKSLDDLVIDNPVVTLDDGDVMVAGTYANSIRINNPQIYIASGDTATVFPSHTTLTSKFYGSGVYARAYLHGGGVFSSPAGTVNVIPESWTPGVNIMETDFFNRAKYGNYKQAEAAPGGNATYKDITLPIAYADGDYVVDILRTANAIEWISDKTNTGFRINYSNAGGWALDWVARHL